MKQYIIDELRLEDYRKLKLHLDEVMDASSIEGIYRLKLPEEFLTEKQRNHTKCSPHYFSIELDETKISFEMLIRASSVIRCDCIQYADKKQFLWLLDYIDNLIDETGIIT